MGEIGETYSGLSGKTKDDFGKGSAKYITYMNVFSNAIIDKNMVDLIEVDDKQNCVKKGDVLFTTSSETPQEVGMSSVCCDDMPNLYLNSFCFGYRPNIEIDLNFLAYVLRSNTIRSQMVLLAQGISRYNISKKGVMNIEVPLPELAEQQAIGEFFKQLDDTIAFHQRTQKKYQNLKKSYLEKMFAKINYAWKQRKLGEITEKVERKAPENSNAPVMMISASSGFINQSEKYSTNNAGSSLAKYTLLKFGELAYNHGFSKLRNFGSCFDLKVKEARIPFVYHSFSLPNDDPKFFATYLNSGIFDKDLKKLVSSSARMDGLLNISYEQYMSLDIFVPTLPEQQAIGEFFRQLDDTIAFHQRELEKYQQLKQVLLDQLFV